MTSTGRACWGSMMRTAWRVLRPTITGTAFGARRSSPHYAFTSADELICDFFAAVEQACRQEGVPFVFVAEDVDDLEDGGGKADKPREPS